MNINDPLNTNPLVPSTAELGIADWLKQYLPSQFSTNPMGTPTNANPMGTPLVPNAAMSYRSDHSNNYSGGNPFSGSRSTLSPFTPQNFQSTARDILGGIKNYGNISSR